MVMSRALANRWRRAQQYTVSSVNKTVTLYIDPDVGDYKATWQAPSSAGGQWHTHTVIRNGCVVFTLCDCPDYGAATHKGMAQCKHTLALGAYLILVHKGSRVPPNSTLSQALRA